MLFSMWVSWKFHLQVYREKMWHFENKQERQCTYNVTLRRVHFTRQLFSWKRVSSKYVCVCVRAQLNACVYVYVFVYVWFWVCEHGSVRVIAPL